MEERPQQQAGAGEQHEGERDFGHHQPVAKPSTAGTARVFQPFLHIGSRGGDCGREAESDSRRHRNRQQPGEDAPIDADFAGAGDLLPSQLEEQARAPRSDGQAQHSTPQREQQALRQKLAHQAEPPGAQRGANRDLPPARRRARQ